MGPANHNQPFIITNPYKEENPEPIRKLSRRERRARERLVKKPKVQKAAKRREKERQMAKLTENQKLFRREVLTMIYNKTGLTDIDAGKIKIEDDILHYDGLEIGEIKSLTTKYFPSNDSNW